MPYPTQVEYDRLIETAWELLEADGVDKLSLAKLAAQFGVKAPSLYRHVAHKTALLQAVNALTERKLIQHIMAHVQAEDAHTRLLELALAYREFAHRHPVTYALAYDSALPRQDEVAAEQLVLPLQAMIAELSGQEQSLTALRGVWALMHGFVMLELSQRLQRGGDLEDAYQQAVSTFLIGIKKTVG